MRSIEVDESSTRLKPWNGRAALRGRPLEVAAATERLLEDLRALGWRERERHAGEPPATAVRLARGRERVEMTIAEPSPHAVHQPDQYEIAATGLVANRDDLDVALASMPFTDLEIELLREDMPVTTAATSRVTAWLPSAAISAKPLAGHGAIFTIHHQTDFLLLLTEALELGLDPAAITVVDKQYRYRSSLRVDAHIKRELGIPVFRYNDLDEGIAEHIRRIEAIRQDSGAERWVPTIVVDDGGYVLPRLLEKFPAYLSLFKGVVEQTSSGIWALRPFDDDLRLPIFSVAESDLKSTVEARGVAIAALTNLRGLFPDERFDGRDAVVVGYGKIGQALAEVLRGIEVTVHVADDDPEQLAKARERGLVTGESIPDLIEQARPAFVFSCAGRGAVGEECFESIRDDCLLVSLTSRDYAFDKEALSAYRSQPHGNVGTRYFKDELACSMILVADGFPINFHFAESMPNQQSDLVMASLLIGAMTLATSVPPWPPGNDPERANSILNEGSLLDDFRNARRAFHDPRPGS